MPAATRKLRSVIACRPAAAVGLLVIAMSACAAPDGAAHQSPRAAGPERARAAGSPRSIRPLSRLARGVMLVATRQLIDPNFGGSVVLLIDLGVGGAIGVIINRPTPVSVGAALPQLDALRNHPESVYLGGPVDTRSMRVLAATDEDVADAPEIVEGLYYVEELSTLRALLRLQPGSLRLRFYAGYAGWGPGQLENEVARGDWLIVEMDLEFLFSDTPERVWPDLIEALSGLWVDGGAGHRPRRTVKLLTRDPGRRSNVNQFTFFPSVAVDRYTISYTDLQQCDRIRTLMFDTSSTVRRVDRGQ